MFTIASLTASCAFALAENAAKSRPSTRSAMRSHAAEISSLRSQGPHRTLTQFPRISLMPGSPHTSQVRSDSSAASRNRGFDLGVEARVRRRVLLPFPVHLQPAVFFFDLDDVDGRVLGQPRREAVEDVEPPVADFKTAAGESARRFFGATHASR